MPSSSTTAPHIPLVRAQPQGIYKYFCHELDLHPNSGVLERLSKVCLLCGTGIDAAVVSDVSTTSSISSTPASTDIGVSAATPGAVNTDTSTENVLPVLLTAGGKQPPSSSLAGLSEACEASLDTALDLSANFVGHEGLRPLLQTIRVVHFFTMLDLSGHGMTSECVAEVVKYLDGVHSLRSLRLNRNPRITQAGGRYLKLFAASNVNVSEIQLEGASITLALTNIIHNLCAANLALRSNAALFEVKTQCQQRQRHSVGAFGSSPQPTPMKRDQTSVSPLAASRGGAEPQSRQHSASQGNSMTVIHHGERQGPSVLLPPFYGAPFLPALLQADGVLHMGNGLVSPPVTPMRPSYTSVPSSEEPHKPSAAIAVGGVDERAAATSVSPTAVAPDPLEGPLEAIDYVFASALPAALAMSSSGSRQANTTASSRIVPPEEFPALQLLRDAMYDLH